MRKKLFVNVPQKPNVEMFIFLDRPENVYINLSCNGKGVVKIVPISPKTTNEAQNHERL